MPLRFAVAVKRFHVAKDVLNQSSVKNSQASDAIVVLGLGEYPYLPV